MEARVDAYFRRDTLGEVLLDLYRQSGLHYACPSVLNDVGRFDLEQKSVRVGEVLDKVAASTGLKLELREGVAIFSRPLTDLRLEELKRRAGQGEVQTRCESLAELAASGDLRAMQIVGEAILSPEPAVAVWGSSLFGTSMGAPWEEPGRWATARMLPGKQELADRYWDMYSKATGESRLKWLSLLCAMGDMRVLNTVRDMVINDPSPGGPSDFSYYCRCLRAPELLEPLLKKCASADRVAKSMAMWALTCYEDPRVTACMLQCLDDPDLERSAVFALGYRKNVGLFAEKLSRILESRKAWHVLSSASKTLGYAARHDPKALKLLLQSRVRWATQGLGVARQPQSFDAICKHLARTDGRGLAFIALGSLRDKRCFDVLLTGLADPEEEDRRHALGGLHRLLDPRGLPYAIRMANDPSGEVRIRVAETVRELSGERDLACINKLLGDQNSSVLVTVMQSLTKMLPPSKCAAIFADEIKRAEPDRRATICSMFKDLPPLPHYVPLLLECLQDTSPEVKTAAAEILGSYRDPRAVEPLLALLKDPSPAVASVAARVLRTNYPDVPGVPREEGKGNNPPEKKP